MLSFWPSLSLLVFFLVILLECRAIAGRVTLSLGGVLMVFCYGAIGAPLLALLLQQMLTPSDASAASMRLMAWLIAPPIEELAKALPVIVLGFLTREARRLSIADLALIGFASGAGFGFVEGNLNALVNGTLPGISALATLGQTGDGSVFFAGHAVSTALVGLAAGIGLRFLPLKVVYAWAPSAFVILWASFDHSLYNWKLLNAESTGALPNAHFVTEILHTATLKGQLATWLLPLGLIVAQFFEAYLCSKAVGARRDLLLAREWRPWVMNEWLVALLRVPLGRAAFGQTLAYFRLRRAFYLASFEARRDPGDPTWTRHAGALEERLKRERSILFDPPRGTWLLPLPVLKNYAVEWTWRMRWVLLFAVLFVFLFLLGPRSLPDALRRILYGDTFTLAMVAAGLAFAVWRIVLFIRQPRPDPLAAEGAAYAGYYTRAMLLGCSFVCGLFPAAALLFGWKAFAPGVAFFSGYLPGWIAQGGNLQTLLGLGTIGGAVAPDPRPVGEAYRHEIAAADERIRLLALDIDDTTGTAETSSPGSARPLQLDAFLDAMAKLDAERDAQARRQLVLDECERHAGEATITDPAPAAQAVKEEFDRLASELLDAAAKELDAIASLEQAYSRAWAEVMQDLDAHDLLRRRLSAPLRAAWQAQDDIGWALRVVEATDEGLLPMQLTLLSELQAVATSAQSARADRVAAGIERIREAAAQYGEEDPFTFAGTQQADNDEAALLAEFASAAPAAESPKAFGLRAPQPVETPPAAPLEDLAAETETPQPTASPVQEALDQLIDSGRSDERYLETIRHLERSAEALRRPLGPIEAAPRSSAPVADKPADASDRTEHRDGLEDLIDAIKRDSGYLDFAKDAQAATPDVASAPAQEPGSVPAPESVVASPNDAPALDLAEMVVDAPALEAGEPTAVDDPAVDGVSLELELAELDETPARAPVAAQSDTPAVAQTTDEGRETTGAKAPIPDEPVRVETPAEPIVARIEPEEPAVASLSDTSAIDLSHAFDDARAPEPEAPTAAAESIIEPSEHREPEPAFTEPTHDATTARSDGPSIVQPTDELLATRTPEEIAGESVLVATPGEDIVKRAEPEQAAPAPAAEQPVLVDASMQEQAAVEPFALVIEDESAAAADVAHPATTPVTLEHSEQLALPLSPAQPEAPREEQEHEARRTNVYTPRTETSGRLDTETPAGAEPPHPVVDPVHPREPDEPASKAEVRSSLFTRLFQSIRRQSADSAAKRTSWDEAKPVDTKPAQSVIAPTIEDQPVEPRAPSVESVTPKAAWLADFAAETIAARTGDTPLQPIEWPTVSRTAYADPARDAKAESAAPVETPAADEHAQEHGGAPAAVEQADVTAAAIDTESQGPADEGVIAPAVDGADAAAVTVDAVKSVELEAPARDSEIISAVAELEPAATVAPVDAVVPAEPAAPAHDAAGSPVAEQTVLAEPAITVDERPAQFESAPSVAPEVTEAEKAQGTDDFTSKADRLSYLLAKLEQAVQAKVAASSAPTEVPAPVADPVLSTPTAIASDDLSPTETSKRPIAAEPKIEAPEPSSEPTLKINQPDETATTSRTEISVGPALTAEPQPASEKSSWAIASFHVSTKPQSKPDRLSVLFGKLFDTPPHEPVQRRDPPLRTDPGPASVEIARPAEAAAAYLAESEILDLRGPHPLPEPPDEPEPDIAVAPLPLQESKAGEAVHASAPAVLEPPHPEPNDTRPIQTDEPVRSQSEPQPLAKTQDVTPAETSPQPSEQSIAPSPRRRPAEPATHFGSRSKPPRPKSPAQPPDVQPPAAAPEQVSQSTAPQRPAASAAGVVSAEGDIPASTPKRDWKLARSEPSKPVDTWGAETAKKPDIRVKTGSGALATTDAAPANSPAASAHTPGKYYGPRLTKADDEPGANTPAQQRAVGLAEALTEYYAKTGEPQPPMHTTDRATLQRIMANGKLEAPRRRGAAWSTSGMSRRGEVAIRLKPGAEKFVELVPSNEIFGQVAHYYPRGVGKGSFVTHIPAGHLEYFDVTADQWVPLLRSQE